MRKNFLAQGQECSRVRHLGLETLAKQREARANIAYELRMREVDLLDCRGEIPHMQHRRSVRPHEEGRFLDGVVTDGNDQIGAINRVVDIVAFRQCSGPHVEPGHTRDGTLAHLRIEERDLDALDKIRQGL